MEQGCDPNQKDYYGDTPIFHQISRYRGQLKLMLELGADTTLTDCNGYTLLHKVASCGTKEDVLLLLDLGFDINAKQLKKSLYSDSATPLEVLFQQDNGSAGELLAMAELFIQHGAEITDRVKEALIAKGKRFELYRSDYNLELLAIDSQAMDRLYALIEVDPPNKVMKHDGVSPIVFEGPIKDASFSQLWDYLVPSNGHAKTAQGEVIRIAGKVAREIMDNGGINWDDEYKKMLDIFPHYFKLGNQLPKEDIDEIRKFIKRIYLGSGDDEPEKLMEYAQKWTLQNETVLPLIQPNYTR